MRDVIMAADEAAMRDIDRLYFSMRKAIHLFDKYSKYLYKQCGLTSPQLVVLMALKQGGSMTSKKLSQWVDLSPATLSPMLEKLTQRQLVERVRCDTDKRKVMVSISESGRRLLQRSPDITYQRFIEQFDALQPEKRNELIAAMATLANMLAQSDTPQATAGLTMMDMIDITA